MKGSEHDRRSVNECGKKSEAGKELKRRTVLVGKLYSSRRAGVYISAC